jgi:hypothetical protein
LPASKLAGFIDDSEADVLSYMDFPEPHRGKIHSTDEMGLGGIPGLGKSQEIRASALSAASLYRFANDRFVIAFEIVQTVFVTCVVRL